MRKDKEKKENCNCIQITFMEMSLRNKKLHGQTSNWI